MPKLFKIGKYSIFFWSNEIGEPIHIHITSSHPSENSTKIWLTKNGGFILANNRSGIPQHDLNQLIDLLSVEYFYICSEWKKYFRVDDIDFYC